MLVKHSPDWSSLFLRFGGSARLVSYTDSNDSQGNILDVFIFSKSLFVNAIKISVISCNSLQVVENGDQKNVPCLYCSDNRKSH